MGVMDFDVDDETEKMYTELCKCYGKDEVDKVINKAIKKWIEEQNKNAV